MDRSPSRFLFASVIFLTLALSGFSVFAAEQAVIAPLAERSLLLDLEQVGDKLIAVGERGHILVSEDSGQSWSQTQAPTRTTLTGIFFLDLQQGWIVGHDQVILKTEDGGKSWDLVYQDIEADSPLFDIYFLDADHGYAIGAYGQFLESFDGGRSWEGRWISEDDFHLNQIIAMENQLFIAAEAGTSYRSDDQGKTWSILSPGYEGSFFGVMPLEANSLLLFGLRGHLFRSDDSGESWKQIETATESSLSNGLKLKDGTLIIAGLAGAILTSKDNGLSFTLIQDPQRKGFSRMQQNPDGTIIASGDFGVQRITLSNKEQSEGSVK